LAGAWGAKNREKTLTDTEITIIVRVSIPSQPKRKEDDDRRWEAYPWWCTPFRSLDARQCESQTTLVVTGTARGG